MRKAAVFLGIAAAVIGLVAAAVFYLMHQVESRRSTAALDATRQRYVEQCIPGITRAEAETLLSSLDFTYGYKPKERFQEGNLLSLFPGTPPADATGLLVGSSKLLGSTGWVSLSLQGLIFIGADDHVIACAVRTVGDGL